MQDSKTIGLRDNFDSGITGHLALLVDSENPEAIAIMITSVPLLLKSKCLLQHRDYVCSCVGF